MDGTLRGNIVRSAILLSCWLGLMWWVFVDHDLIGGGFFVGALLALLIPRLWRWAGP